MYYGLIILSVVIFAGDFWLKDVFRKMRGSSLKISLESALVGSIAGLIALVAINGFKFEFTPFTFIMALASSINGILFTFFGFKALDTINLSLYSLFSMLGGMALPFLQGIFFYGEDVTLAKVVCFAFIAVSLLFTIEKGEKKGGTIYYVGIFVLNGMSGVLSKIFTSAPYEKTSAAGYSILLAIVSAVLSGALLLLFFRRKPSSPNTPASISVSAAIGVTNKIANFILVIALAHVDESVQYPMVTGGVIIVSTLIAFFGKNKPTRKEYISVAVAFAGLLLLFALPDINLLK